MLAVAGAVVGLLLAGTVRAPIGPFDATLRARPALHGVTRVALPPLGSLVLDTHTGPVALDVRVDELRPDEAAAIAADPSKLESIDDEVADDARAALRSLLLRIVLAVTAGAVAGGLLARLTPAAAARGAGVAAVLLLVVGGGVVTSFRAEAVREPEYRGLLAAAPSAVGDVASLIDRFDDYSAQLSDLVRNAVLLYRTADALPRLDPGDDAIRVLHVSDLHNNPQGFDLVRTMARQFEVDVVVDTGDITDWGTPPESLVLEQIGGVDVPYVYVRGNHDSMETQAAVAATGAIVLDGDAAEVAGLRIWGIGDPRYTPDKEAGEVGGTLSDRVPAQVRSALRADRPATVDLALVHDPRSASRIGDLVPLILAGHRHEPSVHQLDEALLLVEGSTGGAGLRGLKGDEPEPLTCTVLYLSRTDRRLVAYDRIAVEGFGGAAARIERHVIDRPAATTTTTTSTTPTTTTEPAPDPGVLSLARSTPVGSGSRGPSATSG